MRMMPGQTAALMLGAGFSRRSVLVTGLWDVGYRSGARGMWGSFVGDREDWYICQDMPRVRPAWWYR